MSFSVCVFQREFDENEVDPYHGKQEKKPDPEAMDLPDELNLDQEEDQAGDEGEGDGEPSGQLYIWERKLFLSCYLVTK